MTTAVIIPGFREQVYSGKLAWRYKPLLAYLKENGYQIIVIKPTWNGRVIQDWVQEAGEQLEGKLDADETLLIGFSFGAMIAAGLGARRRFRKVILCSLSPYFAEDIPHAKKWWLDVVGTRRTEAFKDYSFKEIANNWKAKEASVLLGTIEISRRKYPRMEIRGREAAKLLPNALFVPVPNAGHNIAHPNYAALIEAEIAT